jgi:hypothetical protein
MVWSTNFSHLLQVKLVDGLPNARLDIEEWVNIFSADDGNATLITLCVFAYGVVSSTKATTNTLRTCFILIVS